jgi:hypothetical protein
MARGNGPQQPKSLKSTEIARLKRQAQALRQNLRRRKARDGDARGIDSGATGPDPDDTLG